MSFFDISVVIPTCGRPDSLRTTLQYLVDADRTGLHVEVIVVDNGIDPNTKPAADSFAHAFPVRYLREPRPGKPYAVNLAMNQRGLGSLVVFLDDDMSPEKGWWHGIMSLSERHPDYDFYTGRSHIVWPVDEIPGWARIKAVQCWAHSVLDYGTHDHHFEIGEWPSGNMFWVRRHVIEQGFRYTEGGPPRVDADYFLRLMESGLIGIAGPDAVAAHRLQHELLDIAFVRRRAVRFGQGFARSRLDKPGVLPQAKLLRDMPLVFRLLVAGNLARWVVAYAAAYGIRDRDRRIARHMVALLGIAHNWESLRYRRAT